MVHDLRYALRLVRKSPATTIVVVLTLAIGVGANAAIFSIVHAVLLEPLPYADANRLVLLSERWPTLSGPRPIGTLNYLDWVSQNTVFDQLAAVAWFGAGATLGDAGGEPVHVDGFRVSVSYFNIFGLRAALGRTFVPEDEEPGRAHVVILSHRLWASRFGSDPAIVGWSVRLDGEAYTVIGVMPARTTARSVRRAARPGLRDPR